MVKTKASGREVLPPGRTDSGIVGGLGLPSLQSGCFDLSVTAALRIAPEPKRELEPHAGEASQGFPGPACRSVLWVMTKAEVRADFLFRLLLFFLMVCGQLWGKSF